MTISTMTGRVSPSVIRTSSIAAAESEWIEKEPRSKGIRERPFARSSASATRRTPASSDSDCQLRFLVDAREELAHLRLGEEQAPVLVVAAVDRHADVVQERCEDDDDLRVVGAEAVVLLRGGFHAMLHQQPKELERDVRDDLDVHPGVVVDLQPQNGVHVRHVPPGLELPVVVHALEEAPELAVPARRHAQVHRLDCLGRRQPRLGDDVGRRDLDDLVGLGLLSHAVSLEPRRLPRPSRRTGWCTGRGGR
jgi:hypothetical protein